MSGPYQFSFPDRVPFRRSERIGPSGPQDAHRPRLASRTWSFPLGSGYPASPGRAGPAVSGQFTEVAAGPAQHSLQSV